MVYFLREFMCWIGLHMWEYEHDGNDCRIRFCDHCLLVQKRISGVDGRLWCDIN